MKRIVDRLEGSIVLEDISGPDHAGLRATVRLTVAEATQDRVET